MPNSITIAGTAIRTDAAGRYCLNDLHRASGGAAKDQPALFLRTATTKALIGELEANSTDSQSSPVDSKAGVTGGTYVAKELVYAYAMWISPAFHLKVIRAYDALQASARPAPPAAPALPDFSDPVAAARAWADAEESRRIAADELASAQPKLQALRRIQDSGGSLTITAAAKTLQVKPTELFGLLQQREWIYRARNGAPWLARQARIEAGHMEHKAVVYSADSESGEKTATQARITSRGLVLLARILAGERTKMAIAAKPVGESSAEPATH